MHGAVEAVAATCVQLQAQTSDLGSRLQGYRICGRQKTTFFEGSDESAGC